MHPIGIITLVFFCTFGCGFFSSGLWLTYIKKIKSNALIQESLPYVDGTFSESFAKIGLTKAKIARLLTPDDQKVAEHYFGILYKINPIETLIEEFKSLQAKNITEEQKLDVINKVLETTNQIEHTHEHKNFIIQKAVQLGTEILDTNKEFKDNSKTLTLLNLFIEAGLYDKSEDIISRLSNKQLRNPKIIFCRTKHAYHSRNYDDIDELKFELSKIAELPTDNGIQALRNLCLVDSLEPLSIDDLDYILNLAKRNPKAEKIDILRIFGLILKNQTDHSEMSSVLENCSQIFDLKQDKELVIFSNWLIKVGQFDKILSYISSSRAKMNKELFILRSNVLLLTQNTKLLEEELENSPIIPFRWRLTIKARLCMMNGNHDEAHETMDELFAFLGNDSQMIRTTCSYFEKTNEISCLKYFLNKIKHISVHKKYALEKLLFYTAETSPLEDLKEICKQLSMIEDDNLRIEQASLYFELLDPKLPIPSSKFSKLISDAENLKKKLVDQHTKIILALAYFRSGFPDLALDQLGRQEQWYSWQNTRTAWALIAKHIFELNNIKIPFHNDRFNQQGMTFAEKESLTVILK